MVFRLPRLSSFWVPLTVILLAASLGISDSKNNDGYDDTNDGGEDSGNKTRRNLTGIPQIDYLTDPNLPRELNGYNLSTYPFINRVPSNISFKCDGLKDGFYASIEYSCQLYHHCLFGTRYDFLCANYTAFDQRTFICQFVSEVDCPNSALFFHRNDALYVTKSTTTVAPVIDYSVYQGRRRSKISPSLASSSASAPSDQNKQADLPVEGSAADRPISKQPASDVDPRDREAIEDDADDDYVRPFRRQRRPKQRPRWRPRVRPVYYDYYDYYDDEPLPARRRPLPRRALARYEDDYYDTDIEDEAPRRKMKVRKNRRKNQDQDLDYQTAADDTSSKLSKTTAAPKVETATSTTTTSTTTPPLEPLAVAKTREELFAMSRAPPKIKPPSFQERIKNSQMQNKTPVEQASSTSVSSSLASSATRIESNEGLTGKKKMTTNGATPVESEQYDQSYYDEDYEQAQAPAKKSNKYLPLPTTTTTTTTSTRPPTTSSTTKKIATRTSTTTPPPSAQQVYDYEYEEYEDDQHGHANVPTTTTTTTTTTARPLAGGSRKFRNNRKRPEDEQVGQIASSQSQISPSAPDAVSDNTNTYSSTPSGKHAQINGALETPSRVPALRQPYMSRPRPTLFTKSSNNAPSSTTPISTTTTIKTSVTTSERTVETIAPSRKSQSGSSNSRFKTYDSGPSSTPAAVQETTERSRPPSRFWQRQSKVTLATTTTSTTTSAPDVIDYAYYDESPPLTRYGQRSASTYSQYPQSVVTGPDYLADAPQSTSASEAVPQSPSKTPAINNYQQVAEQPQETYRSNIVTNVDNRYEQSPVPRAVPIEQSNYVTPFATASSLPQTTAAAYLQYHQQQQRQPSQSPQYRQQQQQQQQYPQAQSQPEFISLLPEDEEEPYYPSGSIEAGSSHIMSMIPSQDPKTQPLQASPQPSQQPQSQQISQNRFRNQLTRMFTSPQELFPVYSTPPQYIKTVRPRHVFPTMFLPYATY